MPKTLRLSPKAVYTALQEAQWRRSFWEQGIKNPNPKVVKDQYFSWLDAYEDDKYVAKLLTKLLNKALKDIS